MFIKEIIQYLETIAPPAWQEPYDNCGLLTGNANRACTGIICTLDVTEKVVEEAAAKGYNCIVAHHPIIFSGLKKINGNTYVERTVIAAIKRDIAIYAIHTNLDNIINGVNKRIAEKLGLQNCRLLSPKPSLLRKLYYFTPVDHAASVRQAIFDAGGGSIGHYSECSFNVEGTGTFKPSANTNPFVGEAGQRHEEKEIKAEIIFPYHMQQQLINALIKAHPYEEVAYDIVPLANDHPQAGNGMMGELVQPMEEREFLNFVKSVFGLALIRHTQLLNKPIKMVALCGGAGSFLINRAKAAGADIYITADIKYHEFFDADNQLLLADIGHWESEQFTIDLLFDILKSKFPTFAVLKTEVNTNPVHYFI